MEYSEYISGEIESALIDTYIEEKKGDELYCENELIPLQSDINDNDGVIAEHILLNGEYSDRLKYGLISMDGKYYFFNVLNNSPELKNFVDNKKAICPYCKSNLSTVHGYERVMNNKRISVDPFLRHDQGEENSKECIFYYNKESEESRIKEYSKESIKHIKIKMKLIKEATDLMFKLPNKYEIITDKDNYTCNARITDYIAKKVVKVEADKKILRKDNITKGYVPDLVLYTHDGDEIYVEVVANSGKSIHDYYDIWRRINKTVIECRMIDGKLKFSYLFNEVRDKARKAVLKNTKALVEKKRLENVNEINCLIAIMENHVAKRYRLKRKTVDGWPVLVTADGEPYEYKWNHIIYDDVILNKKLPKAVWIMLKRNGINVREGYNTHVSK